ncbi:MAG: CHAT domain-containing protein [Mongoliitalea sp.]
MKRLLLFICAIVCMGYQSVDSVDVQIAAIQSQLSDNNVRQAQLLFDQYTQALKAKKDYLNLSYFIPYAGYIAEKKGSSVDGLEAAESLLQHIVDNSSSSRDHRQAHLEIHTYFIAVGKTQAAYDANLRALEYTYQMPDYRGEEWGLIERNLGVIATSMGSPDRAKEHTLRAWQAFESDPRTSEESKFNLLNDLGVRYWYEAQWDSAEYFWLEGIKMLETMSPTLTNQYYRKAMIQGNLAAVYDVKGNPQESIRRVNDALDLNKYFLEHGKGDPKWNRAFLTMFYNSANLAAVHKSVGNYQKALQLHEYTLREKQKHFEQGHPEVVETLIHVGQAHNLLKNFNQAEKYLLEAIQWLSKMEGGFYIQAADAHSSLARVYEGKQAIDLAKKQYLLANEFYQKGLSDKADYVYLEFLGNAARFFSLHGEPETAKALAQKGLSYVQGIKGQNTVAGFSQLVQTGEVYFNLKDYQKAKAFADESLEVFQSLIQQTKGNLDSVRVEFDKPYAILIQVKSSYYLNQVKSVSFLQASLAELSEAQASLERRKNTLNNSEDISVLQSQSQELLAFIKKLQLELYEKTGNEEYLNALLAVQESEVYAKIRAQVNQVGLVAFKGVPKQVFDQEARLKASLRDELEESRSLSDFLRLSSEWESFIQLLRERYPDYYQARYANVRQQAIQVPVDLQAIRYFFVEDQLFAMVLSQGSMNLYPLAFKSSLIEQLSENWNEMKVVCAFSHELYKQLWEPFAHELTQERVLIIPDGILFNLSFDMLLTEKTDDYQDFAKKSLLAKHDIYYNFSLLLNQQKTQHQIASNYIAFAPGFVDHMKERYRRFLKDTTQVDKAYLSLLPQPFTLSLAQSASKTLGGKHYVLDESTPSVFKEKAGNHKIIHIGTHAESNNLTPAFSRLIFAKSNQDGLILEDNSIYAYEIYNTDLRAKLAILTACETGKPVFQPGEGMISLSHAFTYAGSESLLTSLWKIDEKASNQITEIFLQYIKEGLPKDRALRLAKLQYLESAHGRTLSPQYWAGLILIGDPEPIDGLGNYSTWVFWILVGVGFMFFSIYFFSKRLISKK